MRRNRLQRHIESLMYLIGIPFADDLTNNLVNGYFEKKSSIFDDLNNN